ncbi:Transcription factor [Thalictrum thalictroides]|uniref:Transcription factor n=1 Tax=Thalictrum thalictroides TaxID=46969 RepID=A0A7J6UYL0_THATH|nr:Transcription factor [Thalictrum thalictroides]
MTMTHPIPLLLLLETLSSSLKMTRLLKSSSFNLFYDSIEDDDLDVAHESSPPGVVDQVPSLVKTTVGKLPLSNRKSKKKKKKTKEDHNSTNKDKSQESIDGFLQSLAIHTNLSTHQPPTTKAKNSGVLENMVKKHTPSILSVEPKFLRPENELRRIFGSDVVRSFENSNASGSSRQIRGGRRGGHNPRKTFLVSPSSHWPRWDGSLSMELVETRDGQHFFKYVHTSSYSQTQRAFEAAKAINDLNGIASILVYHPYHIESLITIAEVLKFSGEHQPAADAISKCLFGLECAWHPMFNPLQGDCQLKYNHETNRPLFSVLFTHMLNMDRRGCHRSALEVCKLLLSLDSDDPMGAMFCIDYFSLRAEEYSWLEQFSEEYRSDNSLWLFPNFSYSLAIARLYLERESCTKSTSKENEMATSTDLMKQALMLHPSILKKLVEKAPLKDPAWTKILKHKFFGSAQAGGPSLEHLIDIYVERNYIIWRLPDLQVLLRDAAQLVIGTLDHNGSDAMDWACVRKEAFSSEKNEYSHLLVSDFSGSVPQMPPDDLRNLMVDPRMAHAMGNGGDEANPEVHARAPREVMNRNPVIVFLESILPWADYGGPLDGNHFEGHDRDED